MWSPGPIGPHDHIANISYHMNSCTGCTHHTPNTKSNGIHRHTHTSCIYSNNANNTRLYINPAWSTELQKVDVANN